MSEQKTNDGAELLLDGYVPLQEFTSPAIYPTPEEGAELGRRLAKLKAEALADPLRTAAVNAGIIAASFDRSSS